MRIRHFQILALLGVVDLLASVAFAFAGVTYHGRLLKPDGTAVTANAVKFKIQIRTPGSENCLMYQEIHVLDMSASNGVFAVTVNDGTATTVNTEPFSLERIFQNRGTFSFAGGKCGAGNSFAPNPDDGRKIVVEFDDGLTGGWEALPAQSINFVPMAMESLTVGGYGSGSMLRVHDGAGSPAAIPALTQTQYDSFLDLLASGIAGSKISGDISGNAAGFSGSLAGDVNGSQNATSVVRLLGRDLDSTPPLNGQVLKWNSTSNRWEPSAGAAGVQDASTSQKGVVQLASSSDSAANLVVQSNDSRLTDSRAPTAHHHDVDEIDSASSKYFSYKPDNTACANGELLKWNSAQARWECGSASSSEATTASNIGSAGVGVFKALSTFDLQFKKLNAASSALSLTDDTANNKIDIGVNAELGGLANLSSNGFVKRTNAGAYSSVASIGLADLNTNAVMGNNTGLLVTDGTQLQNKACSPNEILKWLSPSGWTCASAGISSESDPKVGANTTNFLSKWNGTALVASEVVESGGNVGIGITTPAAKLDVNGEIKLGNTSSVCDSATEGQQRYNSASKVMEFCNGTAWTMPGSATPIGAIQAFAQINCPSGWLVTDGAAVSRATYSGLFAVLSTMYGSGNGSTTFNLPDYRGSFLRSWSNGSGNDPDAASRTNRGDGTVGDNVGTKQTSQYSSHGHGVNDPGHAHSVYDPGHSHGGIPADGGSHGGGPYPEQEGWGNSAVAYTGIGIYGAYTGISIQSSGGNETRPRNVNVLYCIKY